MTINATKTFTFGARRLCRLGTALALSLLATGHSALAQTRVPWYQPFDGTSIWNTPIGSGATYSGPAGIGGGGDFADIDVEYELRALTTDPSVVYGSYNGNPLSILFPYYALPNRSVGNSPNNTSSLIFYSSSVSDYVINQWQYFGRAGFGDSITDANFQYGNYFGDFNDLRPTSGGESAGAAGGTAFGAHGGSEMSGIGGDLRVGEVVSADPIRHALKLNINGTYLYPDTPNHAAADRAGNGFRWPAYQRDQSGTPYTGTNPDLAMGSLLAIPPSVNINNLGLQTAFGMKIAWTLQNFGAYIVDNSGYTGDQMSMEQNAREEINDNYGAPNANQVFAPAVASDLLTLYQQLQVVTDNGSASIGGGGTPLTAQAPSLGPINNVPNGNYYLQNRNTGLCLNVNNSSTSAGAAIIQYPYVAGAANEIFTVTHVGTGYYTITGTGSGLDVSVAGASTADGALLEQDAAGSTPADNQLWSFIPVNSSNGDYLIQARHSNDVIDEPGGTSSYVQLQQYEPIGGTPQRWSLVPASAPAVGVNVAQGKSATASSSYAAAYGPAQAVDGDVTTGWSPTGTDTGAWLEVDLGQAFTLTQVQVVTRQDVDQSDTRQNFTVWASNNPDMSQGHVVLGSQGTPPLPFQATWTAAVTDTTPYRYVAFLKTDGGYAFVSELRAFSDDPSALSAN